MSEDKDENLPIIARSDRVILRKVLANDVDFFIHSLSHGEWRFIETPWSGYRTETTPEQAEKDRIWFMERLDGDEEAYFKRRAVITTLDNIPIGDVSRYSIEHNPYAWCVGIGIVVDEYLNKGLGTEALRLWVEYLFKTSDKHKLNLETWSFNPRMIRSAEKAGFVIEGRLREMRLWQDEWLDFITLGILREEWQKNQ